MPSLFADTHNVVAILEKSDASKGFSQIIDFLSGSYIHYALTLIIQAQVVDLSSHTTRYISPALIQKVFANMRRVGKGFSGVDAPLFENMLDIREVDAEEEVQVPAQDDVAQANVTEEITDDVAQPTSPLPPSPVISSSPPHQSPRPPPPQAAKGIELVVDQEKDAEIEGRQVDTQAEIYNIDLDHYSKVL
nr:hypothetical protein [Tanacetum cinerariifolium]